MKHFFKAVNLNGEIPNTRKLSHREKVKLRNIILAQVSRDDSDTDDEEREYEYVPKPLVKKGHQELPEYVPSSRESIDGMFIASYIYLIVLGWYFLATFKTTK